MTLYNYTFESGFKDMAKALNNIASAINNVASAINNANTNHKETD